MFTIIISHCSNNKFEGLLGLIPMWGELLGMRVVHRILRR